MDTYVTGNTIRQLREKRNLTQAELGERIGVSSKTISKWEDVHDDFDCPLCGVAKDQFSEA